MTEEQKPAKTAKKKGRLKFEVTPKILEQVTALGAQGLTEKQAAYCLGWSDDTFQRRKKEYAKFKTAWELGKAQGIAAVANKLFTIATKCDDPHASARACMFFLKCRDPGNWNDRTMLKPTATLVTPDGQLIDVDDDTANRIAQAQLERAQRPETPLRRVK